jgi:hypothetical protein
VSNQVCAVWLTKMYDAGERRSNKHCGNLYLELLLFRTAKQNREDCHKSRAAKQMRSSLTGAPWTISGVE